MNKIGNQYLKQVKSHLTCPAALKKTFLEQLQGDVEEFLETAPNATLEELTQRFGSPSEMAHSYIDSLDGDELQKQLRKSKIVKRIVLFTCLGILTLVLIVAVMFIIHIFSNNPVTVITTVTEDDYVVITGISEVPEKEALTSDLEPNTSIVVEQSEITEVIEEIIES